MITSQKRLKHIRQLASDGIPAGTICALEGITAEELARILAPEPIVLTDLQQRILTALRDLDLPRSVVVLSGILAEPKKNLEEAVAPLEDLGLVHKSEIYTRLYGAYSITEKGLEALKAGDQR